MSGRPEPHSTACPQQRTPVQRPPRQGARRHRRDRRRRGHPRSRRASRRRPAHRRRRARATSSWCASTGTPSGASSWSCPPAPSTPASTPEACAERELREEIGYRPRTLHAPGRLLPQPRLLQRVHPPLSGDRPGRGAAGHRSTRKTCASLRVPFVEALRLIDDGEIQDAKSIAALLLFTLRRSRRITDLLRGNML